MGKHGGYPGGMGMPGNMGQLMKQAQKMQADMQKQQEELATKEFTATVGGGAVSVTVNGKKIVKSVVISKEAVDPDDVEMLQDLIVSAVNEANKKADDENQAGLAALTGGMGNLGGLF